MSIRRFIYVLLFWVVAHPVNAEGAVLFCTEQHIVGMKYAEGEWAPSYGGQNNGRRYAIRFNDEKSEMAGIHGGQTIYQCSNYFPTKASDVITCINPLIATMMFNYSTESKRFLFSLVGPGGWLGVGTDRGEGAELLSDHIIMGQCQEF